jgi:hypothetical protein
MSTLREFVDSLADELGIKYEARKKWWQRNGVPLRLRREIIAAASVRGVPLDWDELGDKASLSRSLTVSGAQILESVPERAAA